MMPVTIGLTGSIGMGKSTTAQMFADHDLPVWSADEAVHRMYGSGGAAVEQIRKLVPEAVLGDRVDRESLAKWIERTPGGLTLVESVVHPLVAKDRARFIENASSALLVLDIPLLFETGAHESVDFVVVVSAPKEEQVRRVLARPGMTPERLDLILTKQLPDAEKRKRADFVIETTTLEAAREAVHKVIEQIKREKKLA